MKHTAIYMRVSSTQQNMDSQERELKAWVDVNTPNKIKWYEDVYTGKTMNRPGMDQLLCDIHSSKIDNIVCWRLDRLGRTASGLTKFFEELLYYKCNLISLKDCLDLSTPAGRLNANIIASVASYETEIRAERVRAGQQAAKARGKKWGGTKKGQRRSRVAERVPAILKLYNQGTSKAEISRIVGVIVLLLP